MKQSGNIQQDSAHNFIHKRVECWDHLIVHVYCPCQCIATQDALTELEDINHIFHEKVSWPQEFNNVHVYCHLLVPWIFQRVKLISETIETTCTLAWRTPTYNITIPLQPPEFITIPFKDSIQTHEYTHRNYRENCEKQRQRRLTGSGRILHFRPSITNSFTLSGQCLES